MESVILLTGIILFSGTVHHDLHHNALELQKAENSKKTVQIEAGFFDQDVRK